MSSGTTDQHAGTDRLAGAGEHIVQLYETDSGLLTDLAPFVSEGLERGDAVVVLATAGHREQLDADLEARGIDATAARAAGSLVALDAEATLDLCMTGGALDAASFDAVVGGLLRELIEDGRRVRAYGEMVALLWDADDVLNAIELEKLWNELGESLPFSLYCAYRISPDLGPEHAEALDQVCCLHTAVRLSDGAPGSGDGRASERTPPAPGARAGELLSMRLPGRPDAPGRVRHQLGEALRNAQVDRAMTEEAVLVVSELVANAVVHARSPIAVTVDQHGGAALRLAVEDGGPPAPEARPHMVPVPAHGLGMVDALALRWGVDPTASGKVVWAELALPGTADCS